MRERQRLRNNMADRRLNVSGDFTEDRRESESLTFANSIDTLAVTVEVRERLPWAQSVWRR